MFQNVALSFSNHLCPPEPLLQYPPVYAPMPPKLRREDGCPKHNLGQPSEKSQIAVEGRVLDTPPSKSPAAFIRVRQRSGEGVVRRNGCPKGCFWRVRFFSAPLRFSLKTPERQEKTLRDQRRNGLSKNTLLDNRFSARPLRRSFGAP